MKLYPTLLAIGVLITCAPFFVDHGEIDCTIAADTIRCRIGVPADESGHQIGHILGVH